MNTTVLNPDWGAEVIVHQVEAIRVFLRGLGPVREVFLEVIAKYLGSDTESEAALRQSLIAATSRSAASTGFRGEPLDALLGDAPIARSMSTFGENLRRVRGCRNISQKDLAEAVGLSQPSIARLESGRYRPQEKVLEALAKALDCTMADLWPD